MIKLWVTLSAVYIVSLIGMLTMNHILAISVATIETKETYTLVRDILGYTTLVCGTISALWILLTKRSGE